MTLEKRITELETRLEDFVPVVVMLRLDDGKVYPVVLFAKSNKPQTPTFEVVP